MKANHVRNRVAVCRWLAAAALCCLSLTAVAQVPAPTAFERFVEQSTGVGKQTITFSKDGTPLVSPGIPTIRTDGTNEPKVSATGSARNPSGNPVAVTATRKIAPAAASKAVGRAIAKSLPGLATAIAIMELAEELGWDWSKDAEGNSVVKKPDGFACVDGTITCLEYFYADVNGGAYGIGWPTYAQACAGLTPQPGWSMSGPCKQVRNSDGYSISVTNRQKAGGGPAVPVLSPSTDQEFIDRVAAKSGWPAASKLSKVLASPEASADEKIATIPVSLTGPSITPGRVTTQVSPPATNQTTTSTTTHSHTYAGDVITTNNVTNTVITVTSTGAVTSSSTTTESPPAEKDPEDACKTNPDRIGCLDIDTPEGEIPKVDKDVSFSPENLGLGGGSCPPNITSMINGQSVTVFSYVKPCQIITSYVAPLVVLLSTWIAFFIVMPGGKPE